MSAEAGSPSRIDEDDKLARLAGQLDAAVERLARTRTFAKASFRAPVMDLVRRIVSLPGGFDVLYARVPALEASGVFAATDWAQPEVLQPSLAATALRTGDRATVLFECMSQIRMLAVARGEVLHASVSSEHARHFLAQVLALNLDLLSAPGEAERIQTSDLGPVARELYRYLLDHVGYEDILDSLIDEVWRILAQRPIQLDGVKVMVTRIAGCLIDPDVELGGAGRGADRLVSALYGPTQACREDPGLAVYAERLAGLDEAGLQHEALGFARAMHDTGLVSPYHTVFLRHVRGVRDDLIPLALGLSSTGRDALLCYRELVHALVDAAVFPETAQAVYGLALLLERGILYHPPIAPALWRQLSLPLSPRAGSAIRLSCGTVHPPEVFLCAGVLNVLGQPLGIGQGNNPTCQAARALSMWACNDPDYLLQMVAWAARDDEVVMHFEGRAVSSRLPPGVAMAGPIDVDPVSVVVVPHLDRIYREMGRLCADRGEDPHRWVNPEFHGWWVGRGFRIAVDVVSGALHDYEAFLRHFYASYHPFYNGGQPVIHPQPAGIASTDSAGRFVGWHAITIQRVGLDPEGVMRVYFFNPNNDSGQDWGHGVVVSTAGRGERFGESSLPVPEFAARLYLFHYDPLERGHPKRVPGEELDAVEQAARASWAAER